VPIDKGEKPMLKRNEIWIAFLIVLAVLPARAQKTANNKKPEAIDATADTNSATPSATDDPNYVIGAQDILNINVWKDPDVSRTVPVRPDGKISLPLLDDVQAAGLTPMQLAAYITTDLKKYMTDPEVAVIVTQINSQRIYLLGEVGRAGGYTLLPGMTVLQALSDAGGFTPFANKKKIYVMRQINGKPVKFYFNYNDVINGKHSEENIQLKAGDTIVVP
jgi:polysaccharide biosynthesis/export protein